MIEASDQGWGLSLDALKAKMIREAAALGGDAVIIGQHSSESAGSYFMPIGNMWFGFNMPLKKLVGKVIVFTDSEASADALGRVAVKDFRRQTTSDGELAGAFALANDNDFAINSIVVECSVAGVAARTVTALPAIGAHHQAKVESVTFSSRQPIPDGTPACRVVEFTRLQ